LLKSDLRVRKELLFWLLLLVAPIAAQAGPEAKSAILFIGDGMGSAHILLGRAASGADLLAMERMPFSGLVTTLSADGEVTDSAAAATALATGHRTRNGMLGLLPDGRRLETIFERCRRAGKGVGIVTNDALYGATPAAFVVHVPDRGMRLEIIEQVLDSGALVMMGWGEFAPAPSPDTLESERASDFVGELRRRGYEVVSTRDELERAKRARLAGLFEHDRAPDLPSMVKAALARLDRDPDGFFLVVEHASIDWRGHEADASGVALAVFELDRAVELAVDYARHRGQTLVIVTADHETGGLRIEEPGRLGLLRQVKAAAGEIALQFNQDRSNAGAVLREMAGFTDLTEEEMQVIRSYPEGLSAVGQIVGRRAGVSWAAGHTATPVKVFAFGPGARRFAGRIDNTDIPKRIAGALGLGALRGAQ